MATFNTQIWAAISPSYGPINETVPKTRLGTAVKVLGVSLASSGRAMVHLDNLRPEEKLEHQAEQAQYEKQLPFTRSEPYPHPLARSFDALEQVMGEQQATAWPRIRSAAEHLPGS